MVPARGIVERVERALELAGELGHLGAVWELDADGAREGARSLADRATRGEDVGPLAGTVCGWKDCFDVAGLHATGGAPWLAAAGPVTRSAGVVKRMEAAGAVSLGKLAMTQLAWGMMGQTPGRPTCRNPHDPERVPGGSSSGSAVAVATAIVDHAPGTDAGGSVRYPAAACGVVGFKPTYGTVPLDGCMPYAPSFDTGGSIARSVAEAALQHAVLTDTPPVELEGGLGGLRIAFLAGYFTAALTDDVAAMLERTRGRVRADEIDLSWSQDDNRSMSPIFVAEPGAYVRAHDPDPDPELYDPTTFADVQSSPAVLAVDYLQARAAPPPRARRSRSTGPTRRRA
jgi:Asp-tRNA(Asn)/Glu-tRNA(Gln) amidotransferase A subunit family amidase